MSSVASWLSGAIFMQKREKAPNIAAFLAYKKKKEDAMVREAAYAEAEAIKKRRRAASTIHTSPMGVLGEPTTRHTLLGE